MRVAAIMLLLLVALQGCGRKGPLFLPPTPTSAQVLPDQSESNK